jgi:hypothetical protein
VQKFRNIFAAKFFLIQNNFAYTITPRNNPNYNKPDLTAARVIYTPYIPPTAGVSLNFKGFGFTYIFKFIDDFRDTTNAYPKSDFRQVNVNMYGNKYGLEVFYQDYQRFYFHYKGDEIYNKKYISDMRANQFGINNVFIFNGKKFSYNAAFNQTRFQKKNADSFMFLFSFRYNSIRSTDLIPDTVKTYYTAYQNFNRNNNYAFLVQFGWGFTFTKENLFFSSAILGGAGIQNQFYYFPDGSRKFRLGFPLIGRLKLSMGYNGKFLFTGVFANADATESFIKPMQTQQVIYSYGAFLGVRLIKYTKTKEQLKNEARARKQAEKEAARKKKEEEKKKKTSPAKKEPPVKHT